MSQSFFKKGLNAHHVEILDDGTVRVSHGRHDPSPFALHYPSVQNAYDHYRADSEHSHMAWSICYGLEDYLPKEKDEPVILTESPPYKHLAERT